MAWAWWMSPDYNKRLQDGFDSTFRKHDKIKVDYSQKSANSRNSDRPLTIFDIVFFFVRIVAYLGVGVGTWKLLEHFIPM